MTWSIVTGEDNKSQANILVRIVVAAIEIAGGAQQDRLPSGYK